MQSRKLMVIPMLLIFTLAITGVTYAHWDKIVTISGTIETGNLDLIIVSAADDDTGIDPGKDKDVADTVITIDPNDPEKAIITITNAYPSYYVYWHITIENVGTIPAKLKAIIIENPYECLEVNAWDGLGEQLDPGDKGDYSGYVHVKQCAEQGATYTFTVKFEFWNWNEVP